MSHMTRSPRSQAEPFFSLIAPAFDEEDCIAAFVFETVSKLDRLGVSWELICVDDGSRDGTGLILARLASDVPGLRLLTLPRRCGKSAALEAGIAGARGRVIGCIDVDLQNDPSDLGPMLRALAAAPYPSCVVGWRRARHDNIVRRVSSRLANRVSQWITGDNTRDAGCGLKLAHAGLFKALPLFEGMHRFIAPLVRMYGGTVLEVMISHRPRYAGRSKYGTGLGRTVRALVDAIGVRWMIRRSRRPWPAGAQPSLVPAAVDSNGEVRRPSSRGISTQSRDVRPGAR